MPVLNILMPCKDVLQYTLDEHIINDHSDPIRKRVYRHADETIRDHCDVCRDVTKDAPKDQVFIREYNAEQFKEVLKEENLEVEQCFGSACKDKLCTTNEQN